LLILLGNLDLWVIGWVIAGFVFLKTWNISSLNFEIHSHTICYAGGM